MSDLNWQQTAQYWQAKHAESKAEADQANRTAEQAILLARGWKQRAEQAEAAGAIDQAIEELTTKLNHTDKGK